MIAYEVLRQLDPGKVEIPLFVTIGSPLALQEVQDVFRNWTGQSPLQPPACVQRWINVADKWDPVAFDSDIRDEFGNDPRITDIARYGINPGSPRDPHSATGYLSTEEVRTAVNQTVGNAFSQAVGEFVIARDLADTLEDRLAEQTAKTLIQLNTQSFQSGPSDDLDAVGNEVLRHVRKLAKDNPLPDRAEPERLKRFVVAELTRYEVETLRTIRSDLEISRVWSNALKRALILESTHTVQARPANLGYGATGKDIGWAVLDTGIRGDHPHFRKYGNLGPQWDCTQPGPPKKLAPKSEGWETLDRHGHGTHVAATIAGALKLPAKEPESGPPAVEFAGMAPEATIYGFKVLDDAGNGHDSFIVKALDLIADLNENAAKLVIHGVNLSLGGNFDPRVYGCGHTPLCQELRRLWQQGVLVCLAAGNEGWSLVQEESGLMPTNRDISIGDPANLEEAIAVGSIHKTNPHTYGISYFSSRGPTADGRRKPDLVAPGERILSAHHNWPVGMPLEGLGAQDLYIEMSGTSMATPHVSGLLAAFLSIRKEFIGYPDRVKTMLLKGCTDLARDPYMQGAGMPNLIRMLMES
jgi:subtilisin family serine protease